MKELFGQSLSNELAESDRLASSIPGQAGAKNILFSKFWVQLKTIFGVNNWSAREYKSSPCIVVYNKQQYILDETKAPLPFASVNFATELSEEKWLPLGSETILALQSDVETANPTENTKFTSALRAFQGFIYWLKNSAIPELNTTSKTVVGAINEHNSMLSNKADLVGGVVPSNQLPSYVDDVIEVANYASLPAIGEIGKIYVTIDNNNTYRWSGSAYVSISNPISFASQPEAEGNTENTKVMTSLRVFQNWINNIRTYSISDLLTTAKTLIGSINEVFTKIIDLINDLDGGGFVSWDSTSTKWSIAGTAPTASFNLLVGGKGRINGARVSFAPQSIANLPTTYSFYYVAVNASGVISLQSTIDITTHFPLFQLFVGVSGTYYIAKENHPFSFIHVISRYIHNNFGTLINGSGGNVAIASTNTQIAIQGSAILSDHGLDTDISDSAGIGVTWIQDYKNSSSQWALNTLSVNIAPKYNLSGVVMSITAGKYGVYRLYATKDDGNGVNTARYIAIMHTTEYANQNSALTAINTNLIVEADGLLVQAEIAQLGYCIVNSAGQVVQTVIQKKTAQTGISGGTSGLAPVAYDGQASSLIAPPPSGFTSTNQAGLNSEFAQRFWTEDLTTWAGSETTLTLTSNVFRDFGSVAVTTTVAVTLTAVTSPRLAHYAFKFKYGTGGSFTFTGVHSSTGNPSLTVGKYYEASIIRGELIYKEVA